MSGGDSSSAKRHDGLPPSNRLYLKGVPRSLEDLKEKLEICFTAFGEVEELFLPDRSSKPYAFVTFKSVDDAETALASFQERDTTMDLFTHIRRAGPRNDSTQPGSVDGVVSRRRTRAVQDWDENLALAQKSNVIVQAHRSHSDRLLEYLQDASKRFEESKGKNYESNAIKESSEAVSPVRFSVVGMTNFTAAGKISVLYCEADESDAETFAAWLESHPFASRSCNAVYLVDSVRATGKSEAASSNWSNNFPHMDRISNVARRVYLQCKRIKNPSPFTIRLAVFPPKMQDAFLTMLEREIDGDKDVDGGPKILLSPTDYTHKVAVIQICDAKWNINESSEDACGLFMTGISAAVQKVDAVENDIEDDDDICRAYHKLHEAIFRYPHPIPDFTGKVGVDVGAAPGGWSKFLATKLGCSQVYSVDPGKLAQSVLELDAVTHLAMTIERALPELKKFNAVIDIWVSDMCVKDMQGQVDWLLAAREQGVVRSGSMFVLTVKCSRGHSKIVFDLQAKEQADRLTEGGSSSLARDVHVLHLFSNRLSERTIVGYLR